MCGIVGFSGSQGNVAKPILLDGLKRLEYRGYDSAGLALAQTNGDFLVHRCVGEVQNLVDATQSIGKQEVRGIAHTRWATHGVPSEINAHPHRAGRLVLVHNGIIENHNELRNFLKEKGFEFSSQTDTEVFAKLIQYYLDARVKSGVPTAKDVVESLKLAIQEAEGHYAILFMVQGLDGMLFGVQAGAPLVTAMVPGRGALVASDLQAILPLTNSLTFVPTKTAFQVTPEGFQFFHMESFEHWEPVQLKSEVIDWNPETSAKGGFKHFMLKEIFEQPAVIAETLSGRIPPQENDLFVWDNPKEHALLWKMATKLHLVACGTAYHSALVAKYFFERFARIPVEVDIASEFRYRDPIFEPGSVMGVISQSGETADTLAALRMAVEKGVPTFSVCNVPGSTIARESSFVYRTKAGPEISVASTKAFTAQLVILSALALDVAKLKGKQVSALEMEGLARVPQLMDVVLANSKQMIQLGAKLKDQKTILFMGRGPMYPLSLEGALKLKEISYYHAEGYAAGELKHGPIALVDEKLTAIVCAPSDALLHKTLSNLEEIKSRKGRIIGIGEEDNKEFAGLCQDYIAMPKVSWGLAPMIYSIPLQLMSYGLADELGCEIDKPRNLAKSVTVE